MLTSTALLAATILADPAQCSSLAKLKLSDATTTSAQWTEAGPFTPPSQGPNAAPPIQLPSHCRVVLVLTPSADSHIETELWLPEKWNGKFQAVGNGGWAGTIPYAAMGRALGDGYATAGTDTGHKGANALFAIGHPEKLIDLGYRAVHETAVQSKTLISSYYRRPPELSYWNGCSTGGRQGLVSAQKYPEDFDAIIAGAPANYWSHLHAWDLAMSAAAMKDPAHGVTAAKLAVVNKAVLDACDARDGVKDGFLNEPRSCTFDVASLQCTAGDADSCLTAAQVALLKRMYAPARTTSGRDVFAGMDPGSELGWTARITGQPPGVAVGSFQVAYQDAQWDPRSFDLDRDLPIVDQRVGSVLDAIAPDLSAFKKRGGKLLLYHGWNDTAISAGNTINYYNSVLGEMGRDQSDWIRLFMAPGMGHCQGGVGPGQVNWMAVLERWRESDQAPDRIDAARVVKGRVEMTRPLCPYPQIARYTGAGDTNDAASFVCRAP
jgi:feruloyl esterase